MTTTHRARLVANLDVPSQWRLGSAFVPKGRYIDLEFLELETMRLFPRTWLNACRVDDVDLFD
jgi:glycine betaine catabolism A